MLRRGGGEEIRTLAPAKPTYRISNPDPSTTWVHLHILKIGCPIHNLRFAHKKLFVYISGPAEASQSFLKGWESSALVFWVNEQDTRHCGRNQGTESNFSWTWREKGLRRITTGSLGYHQASCPDPIGRSPHRPQSANGGSFLCLSTLVVHGFTESSGSGCPPAGILV